MSKFGWDLPPGCTQRDIDEAFGVDESDAPDGYTQGYADGYADRQAWDFAAAEHVLAKELMANGLTLQDAVAIAGRAVAALAQTPGATE